MTGRIKMSRWQKNMILLALIPIGMCAVYFLAFHRVVLRPVLLEADTTKILEGTQYNDSDEITFYGENLTDIIAVYVNGRWAKDLKVTTVSDTETRILFPKAYYSQAGTFSVSVEKKVNADVTTKSNPYEIQVIPLEDIAVPKIEGVTPEKLVGNGMTSQEICVWGSGLEEGDVLQVNGQKVKTEYDGEGVLKCRLSYEDIYDVESVRLRVVKLYNGYATPVKSNDWLIKIEREDAHSQFDYSWQEKTPYIALAFGSIDQNAGTNSLEAFAYHYERGQRVFETDLSFTSDGVLICRDFYDEENWKKSTEGYPDYERHNLPKSWRSLQQNQWRYTYLTFDDVCRLMAEHPDLYIVTDTKYKNPNAVFETFYYIKEHAQQIDASVLERLVVQVYNQSMYYQVMDICPVSSVIYALGQSNIKNEKVVEFVAKEGIGAVSMPLSRAEKQEFLDDLNRVGCRVYVSDKTEAIEWETWRENGVFGFFVDEPPEMAEEDTGADRQQEIRQGKRALVSYLEDICSDRYMVAMLAKGEGGIAMTEPLRERFAVLGLDSSLLQALQGSYAALLDSGEVIYQETADDALQYEYQSAEGIEIAFENAHIVVEGKEYAPEVDYLQIVVYDKLTESVIDSICFSMAGD